MSYQRAETLDVLSKRLDEMKSTLDLVVFVDAMSYHALIELFAAGTALKQEISELTTTAAGGFLNLLREKFRSKLTSKTLSKKLVQVFVG